MPTPCRGGSNQSAYCAPGLTGPLCRICERPGEVFSLPDGQCNTCPLTGVAVFAPTLGGIAAASLALWLMYAGCVRIKRSIQNERLLAYSEKISTSIPRLGLMAKAKLLVAYFQVVRASQTNEHSFLHLPATFRVLAPWNAGGRASGSVWGVSPRRVF